MECQFHSMSKIMLLREICLSLCLDLRVVVHVMRIAEISRVPLLWHVRIHGDTVRFEILLVACSGACHTHC